eukprot:1674605-Rhodomonas_salina.1
MAVICARNSSIAFRSLACDTRKHEVGTEPSLSLACRCVPVSLDGSCANTAGDASGTQTHATLCAQLQVTCRSWTLSTIFWSCTASAQQPRDQDARAKCYCVATARDLVGRREREREKAPARNILVQRSIVASMREERSLSWWTRARFFSFVKSSNNARRSAITAVAMRLSVTVTVWSSERCHKFAHG